MKKFIKLIVLLLVILPVLFSRFLDARVSETEEKKIPQLIRRVQPEYPKDALKQRVSGKVVLEVCVNTSGRVNQAKVISGHALLRHAALEAVKQWLYKPFSVENKTVPVKFTVTVSFKLDTDRRHDDLILNLHLYQGMRSRKKSSGQVVTASFLRPLFVGNLLFGDTAEDEAAELRRVFNLADIKLLAKAAWGWKNKGKPGDFEMDVTNGNNLRIRVSRLGDENRFKAEVIDMGAYGEKVLLESVMDVPQNYTSVLGFEDQKKNPFFLSVHRLQNRKVLRKEPLLFLVKDKRPRLLHRVNPDYPKDALKARVSGEVLLNARTDKSGRVTDLQVLSGHPLLNMAAIRAVRQWRYEPYVKDGKPGPVSFTVSVRFRLDTDSEAEDVFAGESGIEHDFYFQKSGLSNVLKLFSRISGKKFALVGDVNPEITLKLGQVPWPVALQHILQENRLRAEKTPSGYRITETGKQEKPADSVPGIWPTEGYLTAAFGDMRDPFTGKTVFHRGIDIAAKAGSPVKATARGVVIETGYDRGRGNWLKIEHALSYATLYSHLQKILVKKGSRVRQGEKIGLVGSTGKSTAPHLHYEVLYKGKPMNPFRFVKKR